MPVEAPAPGPAARVARSAGQLGAVVTIIDFVRAYDVVGARWSAEQAAERWPATTAVITLAVVSLHNAANWWRTNERRRRRRRASSTPPATGYGGETLEGSRLHGGA